MKSRMFCLGVLLPFIACSQLKERQEKAVGGPCEGCEAVFEYGNKRLSPVDTLPDFGEPGPKLKVTGTIYHRDGTTPASGVILYIYHTDQTGVYPTRGNETGWARRHGYIRGWIKTGQDGQYTFYTLRPGAYPGRENPEHIHPVIKEPGYQPYWIDEYLFDDDPILTDRDRRDQQRRGGKGIIKPAHTGDCLQVVRRDIVLGLNVPGYKNE